MITLEFEMKDTILEEKEIRYAVYYTVVCTLS